MKASMHAREQKLATYLAFAMLASGLFYASSVRKDDTPDVIRAKRFELVDKENNVLICIHNKAGTPAITIEGKDGPVADISMNQQGFGRVLLMDPKTRRMVSIECTKDQDGVIEVFDETGKRIAHFSR